MQSHPHEVSRLRKAHFALTNYRNEIAYAIRTTPKLRRVHDLLNFIVIITTATGLTALAHQALTTPVNPVFTAPILIFLVPLVAISHIKFILFGTTAAMPVVLLWVLGSHPEQIPLLYITFVIAAAIMLLLGGCLTRHAVIIGSQLWEQEIESMTGEG